MNKKVHEICSELQEAFLWIPDRPVVGIFGSARLREDSQAYKDAREFAKQIGNKGWAILTGGGPGIMEAANRGGMESGVPSIGLNIVLPHEQKGNEYQTVELMFNNFTARKTVFTSRSNAFIAFKGGFGTMDEIFDTLTQIQTGKLPHTPIILFGKDFWEPTINVAKTLLAEKLISPKDMDLLLIVDTIEEAVDAVIKHCHKAVAMTI